MLQDDLLVQLHLHHTLNETDNVWICPHLLAVYEGALADATSPSLDLDNSGNIDEDDLDLWLNTYGTFEQDEFGTVRGDLNLNFIVDIIDFGEFAGNFGQAADILGGDLIVDGVVDIQDFGVFAGNFGFNGTGNAVTVPEPTSLLVALGTLFLLRRSNR